METSGVAATDSFPSQCWKASRSEVVLREHQAPQVPVQPEAKDRAAKEATLQNLHLVSLVASRLPDCAGGIEPTQLTASHKLIPELCVER